MSPENEPNRALARRLRGLRTSRGLKQPVLAKALGVSVPLISSWENDTDPKTPPVERLSAYALFFATPRSVDGGRSRLLDPDELTSAEHARQEELDEELQALRAAVNGPIASPVLGPALTTAPITAGFWHFGDGSPVTIVCAPLPAELRADESYTDPNSPDYVELHRYTDLDALVELYGHVLAANPERHVTYRLTPIEDPEHLTTHLALLGGVDWNPLTREVLDLLSVPVTQKGWDDTTDQGAFEVHTGGDPLVVRPKLRRAGDKRILVEDVALFVRGPNPFNLKRTVTICNGMYGRGTHAAVRALTDVRFRDRNAAYVRERFADAETFSILFRARVVGGVVPTPDWTRPDTILHEWPERVR